MASKKPTVLSLERKLLKISKTKKIAESNPNSNVILSPLSAYQALSLVSNGARGETQSNIVSKLGYKNQIEVNVDNQKIIDSIEGIQMIVLNAIYFKSKWLKEFRKQNTKKYDFIYIL